jgi:hypothetical protein
MNNCSWLVFGTTTRMFHISKQLQEIFCMIAVYALMI